MSEDEAFDPERHQLVATVRTLDPLRSAMSAVLAGVVIAFQLFADPPGALTGEVDMDFTRMNMVMRSARVFELMSNPNPILASG